LKRQRAEKKRHWAGKKRLVVEQERDELAQLLEVSIQRYLGRVGPEKMHN
jgi:hypothetical protein